jgi:hypothetical protein
MNLPFRIAVLARQGLLGAGEAFASDFDDDEDPLFAPLDVRESVR